MSLSKNKYLLIASLLIIIFSNVANSAYYPPVEPQPMPSHYWYFGGTGGVSLSSSTTLDGVIHTTYQSANWDAGFEIGLQYRSWRFEGEYLYQPINIKEENGISIDGHLRAHTALVNVIYDFLNESDIYRPYIGAGVGYANITYPDRPSDSTLGYQGQAGIRFAVYDNASFLLGYRYFGTSTASSALGEPFHTHLINAGFIYFFD